MLASIISLLQDQPRPAPKKIIQVDMGGGGALGPRYRIEDYLNVLGTFREVPNEHPVARTQRRTDYLAKGLAEIGKHRDELEKAGAIGMLYGAALERRDAEETNAAKAVVHQATLDQLDAAYTKLVQLHADKLHAEEQLVIERGRHRWTLAAVVGAAVAIDRIKADERLATERRRNKWVLAAVVGVAGVVVWKSRSKSRSRT